MKKIKTINQANNVQFLNSLILEFLKILPFLGSISMGNDDGRLVTITDCETMLRRIIIVTTWYRKKPI